MSDNIIDLNKKRAEREEARRIAEKVLPHASDTSKKLIRGALEIFLGLPKKEE